MGIASEHGASWFGECNDESIDGRTTASVPSKQGCASSEVFGDLRRDVADLEKAVLPGVATSMTSKTLDQYHGGHEGWP